MMDKWVIPFENVEVHGHWLAPIDGEPIAVIEEVRVTGVTRPAILKKIKDFVLAALAPEDPLPGILRRAMGERNKRT